MGNHCWATLIEIWHLFTGHTGDDTGLLYQAKPMPLNGRLKSSQKRDKSFFDGHDKIFFAQNSEREQIIRSSFFKNLEIKKMIGHLLIIVIGGDWR